MFFDFLVSFQVCISQICITVFSKYQFWQENIKHFIRQIRLQKTKVCPSSQDNFDQFICVRNRTIKIIKPIIEKKKKKTKNSWKRNYSNRVKDANVCSNQ